MAQLRKHATLAGNEFYDLDTWEGLRVATGSASVALAMAAELSPRVRYRAEVSAIEIADGGVTVSLAHGEQIRAEAVVCGPAPGCPGRHGRPIRRGRGGAVGDVRAGVGPRSVHPGLHRRLGTG